MYAFSDFLHLQGIFKTVCEKLNTCERRPGTWHIGGFDSGGSLGLSIYFRDSNWKFVDGFNGYVLRNSYDFYIMNWLGRPPHALLKSFLQESTQSSIYHERICSFLPADVPIPCVLDAPYPFLPHG
jgi:hypothetical protein